MKKGLFFTLVTSIALFCVSCSDNDIPPPDSQITDAVQSRSMSASSEHYYYYRGKKIPLNVHPTKRYVVVEQDASASLMALGVRAEQDSYYVNETQRGYIVDTAQTIVTGFIPGKTYTLSVTASNQYAWDTYYFEYTHPYSNGMLNENQEEEEEQL